MGYHHITPSRLEPFPDRDAAPRSISEAAGMKRRDAKLGLRTYTAEPGEQLPTYHYHDEQVEAFYVIERTLHIETPEEVFRIAEDEVFIAEPKSPHRSFNPAAAESKVRVLALGAPSVKDHHAYEPDDDQIEKRNT